jgi:hypothetical protein
MIKCHEDIKELDVHSDTTLDTNNRDDSGHVSNSDKRLSIWT